MLLMISKAHKMYKVDNSLIKKMKKSHPRNGKQQNKCQLTGRNLYGNIAKKKTLQQGKEIQSLISIVLHLSAHIHNQSIMQAN